MSVKSSVLEVVDKLSEDVTWHQVMYHLSVRAILEDREKQAETAEFISQEDVFREFLEDEPDESGHLVSQRAG